MQTFVQLVAGGVLDRFPQRLFRIARPEFQRAA